MLCKVSVRHVSFVDRGLTTFNGSRMNALSRVIPRSFNGRESTLSMFPLYGPCVPE